MIDFEVKYEAGHSYHEWWQRTSHYCPACGVKDVWHETGGGDYYVGEQYMCRGCGAAFYLPNGANIPHDRDWQAKQRIEALRQADSAPGDRSEPLSAGFMECGQSDNE